MSGRLSGYMLFQGLVWMLIQTLVHLLGSRLVHRSFTCLPSYSHTGWPGCQARLRVISVRSAPPCCVVTISMNVIHVSGAAELLGERREEPQ